MRLHALSARNFGCVRSAELELAPGVNVLFGPNDLGKSSLVAAVRAALLLPHSSRTREAFVPWSGDAVPEVELVLETDRRLRVKKSFGSGSRGSALLESSKDGATWIEEARAREVDDILRRELRLGVKGPGGRGGPKGLPETFLTTLLLPDQGRVTDVFARRLDDDPDASGRERLTDALQAMARDPVFAAVLERAQKKVDEAFTARGNLKRTKDAPLKRIQDQLREVEARLEGLEDEERKGESVREALGTLYADRARVVSALEQAGERRAAAERALHAGLRAAAGGAARERDQAEAALATAREAERAAEAELERLRADGAAARRLLARRELEHERERLVGERARVVGSRGPADRALKLGAQIEATSAGLAEQDAGLGAKREELARLEAEVARAERDAELLERGRRLAALEAARAALAEADEAARSAEGVPDAATLRALEKVAGELRVAEAEAGVGIRVGVRPLKRVDVEVVRDGGKTEKHAKLEETVELEAEREIVVRVPGHVEIEAVAGKEEARAALERARARYAKDVQPVLETLGIESLEDLRGAVDAAERARGKARELESEARSRLGLEGTDRAALERELEAAEPDDANEVRERLLALPPGTDAADALRSAGEERARAARGAEALRLELTREEAGLAGAAKQLEEAHGVLAALVAEDLDGAEPGVFLAGVDERVAELDGALEEAGAKLATLLEAEREDVPEAEAALARAGEARAAAEEVLRAAASRKEQAARELHAVAGTLDGDTGEGDGEVPEPGRLAELRDALDEARRAEREACEELERVRRDVDQAEGALQQAGGLVARDAAERLRASRERLREQLESTQLDYEAWRLLTQTLEEAESEETAHLGRSVMPAIRERFGALTGGRYGDLVLGPDLEAEGIAAAGGTRSIEALSVGTQEQLSTLFRLVLAEELGTAVILDDQLTGSDPRRMAYFRELMRAAAEVIQVIVVTCHPEQYLEESELPRDETVRDTGIVRAIDLERLVTRWEPG